MKPRRSPSWRSLLPEVGRSWASQGASLAALGRDPESLSSYSPFSTSSPLTGAAAVGVTGGVLSCSCLPESYRSSRFSGASVIRALYLSVSHTPTPPQEGWTLQPPRASWHIQAVRKGGGAGGLRSTWGTRLCPLVPNCRTMAWGCCAPTM